MEVSRSSMLSTTDLTAEIRKIVGEILEMDPKAIDPEAQLVEDLGMDSMMALEILATIEKRFKIKVPEESLVKMTTLNQVIQMAQQYVQSQT